MRNNNFYILGLPTRTYHKTMTIGLFFFQIWPIWPIFPMNNQSFCNMCRWKSYFQVEIWPQKMATKKITGIG